MDETQQQAAAFWENDVQSGLHRSRYAEALLQVSASSHGMRLQVPGRHIGIGVWVAFVRQGIVNSDWVLEWREMGWLANDRSHEQECWCEDYIPKAEIRHFCLMPREMTNRVLP